VAGESKEGAPPRWGFDLYQGWVSDLKSDKVATRQQVKPYALRGHWPSQGWKEGSANIGVRGSVASARDTVLTKPKAAGTTGGKQMVSGREVRPRKKNNSGCARLAAAKRSAVVGGKKFVAGTLEHLGIVRPWRLRAKSLEGKTQQPFRERLLSWGGGMVWRGAKPLNR